ncbi:MAG: gamma-glutamyl-gamma-aminobutyrate hydrolase family protein, partial [Phycisphaeraceae bacterium]|nr:gamma-glutamyl-gamma-aminobutyrate hydrolase family protein [Phycisphaeraceae bacterium]
AALGATPVLLPHETDCVDRYIRELSGLILTGGVDPDTRPFGQPLHANARLMDPTRQAFELALLNCAQNTRPELPILGVCLGMQLMTLHAGGALHQYLPDILPSAEIHAGNRRHKVHAQGSSHPLATLDAGLVVSSHRQAVSQAGRLTVLATAPDGVIEAVGDPQRRCYLGVQWHPERGDATGDAAWNRGLLEHFVMAARARA